jgi:hypothetical protein
MINFNYETDFNLDNEDGSRLVGKMLLPRKTRKKER